MLQKNESLKVESHHCRFSWQFKKKSLCRKCFLSKRLPSFMLHRKSKTFVFNRLLLSFVCAFLSFNSWKCALVDCSYDYMNSNLFHMHRSKGKKNRANFPPFSQQLHNNFSSRKTRNFTPKSVACETLICDNKKITLYLFRSLLLSRAQRHKS